MESINLQQQLFQHLREQLPPHISLVDQLCELLDLSADSVYRRIRGEKPLALQELQLICKHYYLSIDQLLQLGTDSVLFEAPELTAGPLSHADYMRGLLNQVRYFNSFTERRLHYLCKDIPVWYFYLFPEMASFKSFFWEKAINNAPGLVNKQFSLEEFPYTDCFELGQQILQEYNRMPSVELWNLESINSTINQIAYYRDAGMFRRQADLAAVITSFQQMLDHLQSQTAYGRKFMPGHGETAQQQAMDFYVNELILGSNTLLLKLNNTQLAAVSYSVLRYLTTRDARFTSNVSDTFQTLLSRSILISQSGEKERNRFFNALREKVEQLR